MTDHLKYSVWSCCCRKLFKNGEKTKKLVGAFSEYFENYCDWYLLEIYLKCLFAPQGLEVCRMGLLFPVFSICYIVTPWWSFSQTMRKPFIKFICNSSSYFTFLCKSISQSIYNDNAPDTLSAHPTDSSTRQTSCPLLWRLILFIFCALPLSHYSFIMVLL